MRYDCLSPAPARCSNVKQGAHITPIQTLTSFRSLSMRRKLNFKVSRDPEFVDAIFEGEIRDRKFFLVDPQCSIFLSFLAIESYPRSF